MNTDSVWRMSADERYPCSKGMVPDPMTVPIVLPKRIGVASDHGGHNLKKQLARMLGEAGYEVADFGNNQPSPDDDYPDFVVPLAHAVAAGKVDRGVAIPMR